MQIRSSLFLAVTIVLTACASNSAGLSPPTNTPLIADTHTPIPAEKTPVLPTATAAPTITHTPTITPTSTLTHTPTAAPVDPILAGSGFDIAAISVSYPRLDIMQVDFDYRLRDGVDQAMITLQLPQPCRDGEWSIVFDFPLTAVWEPIGTTTILYKLPIEGVCAFDSFYINIYPLTDTGEYWNIEDIAYQEKINLSYRIERTFPTINTNVVTLKSFRFESTGSWTGNVLVDYVISEKIPLDIEQYYFSIYGSGGGGACSFRADGPIIEEYSGIYALPVTLPDDLSAEGCTDGYTSYLFDNFFFYVVDAFNDDTLISHTPIFDALFRQ